MSKPDWKDSPAWANYLAMDGDGEWYWYEQEPELMDSSWEEGSKAGRISYAGRSESWRKSLEPRP